MSKLCHTYQARLCLILIACQRINKSPQHLTARPWVRLSPSSPVSMSGWPCFTSTYAHPRAGSLPAKDTNTRRMEGVNDLLEQRAERQQSANWNIKSCTQFTSTVHIICVCSKCTKKAQKYISIIDDTIYLHKYIFDKLIFFGHKYLYIYLYTIYISIHYSSKVWGFFY